ncbi:MAG: ubiquinol-cytochrome C chaperone family protein [Pseudomonadota bacterium]
MQASAGVLYAQLIEQARTPAFYGALGVPDSLDGRYEMIALHAFIALRRLRRDGGATETFAQALFDAMFADMDRSLREIGVSDLSVGKRVKEMARGLYGRIAAYEAGIAAAAGGSGHGPARRGAGAQCLWHGRGAGRAGARDLGALCAPSRRAARRRAGGAAGRRRAAALAGARRLSARP